MILHCNNNKNDDDASRSNSILLLRLPDEVLIEVLSWLGVQDLLLSINQVSHKFHSLVEEKLLWERKLFHSFFFESSSSSSSSSPLSSKECWIDEKGKEQRGIPTSSAAKVSFQQQFLTLTRHQMERCCYLAESLLVVRNGQQQQVQQQLQQLEYGSITVRKSTAFQFLNQQQRGKQKFFCLASSCDHPHERIENVLVEYPKRRRIRRTGMRRFNNSTTNGRTYTNDAIDNGGVIDYDDDSTTMISSVTSLLGRVINDDDEQSQDFLSRRNNNIFFDGVDWDLIQNDDRMTNQTFRGIAPSSAAGGARTTAITSLLFRTSQQQWWSSKECRSQKEIEQDEVLVFSTRYPITLVTEIAILPYTDWIGQVYTWKNVVIRVYNLPIIKQKEHQRGEGEDQEQETEEENDDDSSNNFVSESLLPSTPSTSTTSNATDNQRALEYLFQQKPVYESKLLVAPPPRNNSWQYYPLSSSSSCSSSGGGCCGVIGNVITITLIGKNYRQFDSSGYYCCVQKVASRGIPLYYNNNEQEQVDEDNDDDETIIPLIIR